MQNRNWMALLAATLLIGCGNGNNATNNGTNASTVNNTAANNTTPNNTTNTTANNTPNNTTANNTTPNTTSNPRTEPYITQFRYYVANEDVLGTNSEGFTISVINGDIANEGGNLARMSEADATAFESTHLGPDTIAKMRSGWGCRVIEPAGGDMGPDMGADAGGFVSEATYWFEARIQEGGSNREITEVTGCVLDADPAVKAIADAVDALGASYL